MQQPNATIYLAEERGVNETMHFRSLHTFNYGNYFNAHKKAFNNIYVINDDTLDGGCSLHMLVQEYSYIILLPVLGAINYRDSLGNENLLAAGQVELLHINKGVTIEISNPFKDHLVNFIQVCIKGAAPTAESSAVINTYDVNAHPDSLVAISTQNATEAVVPFRVSIGKFNGRGETVYSLQHDKAKLFVFVLEGAFEVEGRLLHARDGLALLNITKVEMEALSNDAIILAVETC